MVNVSRRTALLGLLLAAFGVRPSVTKTRPPDGIWNLTERHFGVRSPSMERIFGVVEDAEGTLCVPKADDEVVVDLIPGHRYWVDANGDFRCRPLTQAEMAG